MTSQEQIAVLLKDPAFGDGEKLAVRAEYGMTTPWETKLWELIQASDVHNLQKIFQGFPDEVTGYTEWSCGALEQKLNEAGYRL